MKKCLGKISGTSQIFNGNFHVPYKYVETSPSIRSRKIIGNTQFYLSCHVSDGDGVIGFHINYEQVPNKDAKLKDQANSLKHDGQSETNTFSVTDETKNKKVNIQQEDISKKNHPQDDKSGINSKSLISNHNTLARTCIVVHNCQ